MVLSLHLSVDLSCQGTRDACRGSSESLGSPRSLCSECQEGRRRCSDAKVLSFNVKPGRWLETVLNILCAFDGMRAVLHVACVPL